MSVTLQLDKASVRALTRKLKKTGTELARANVKAVNKTVTQLRKEVRVELKKEINAKAKFLNRRMWVKKAKRDLPRGSVHFGLRYLIPLRAFPVRQTKKGVSARILKGGRSTLYPRAFIRTINKTKSNGETWKHKGVFRRAGRDRLPIRHVKGINPVGLLKRSGIFPKLRGKAPDMFVKNLNREHRTVLLRMQGKIGGRR